MSHQEPVDLTDDNLDMSGLHVEEASVIHAVEASVPVPIPPRLMKRTFTAFLEAEEEERTIHFPWEISHYVEEMAKLTRANRAPTQSER